MRITIPLHLPSYANAVGRVGAKRPNRFDLTPSQHAERISLCENMLRANPAGFRADALERRLVDAGFMSEEYTPPRKKLTKRPSPESGRLTRNARRGYLESV